MIINQFIVSPVGISRLIVHIECRLFAHEIFPLEPRLLLIITEMVDYEEIVELETFTVIMLLRVTYAWATVYYANRDQQKLE